MTDLSSDPRLDLSKAIPLQEVADRLGLDGLRRSGQELVGPCPVCGGRDRFAINLRTHLHLCRRCGLKGGDQVGLVMSVLGLPFRDALAWLMGDTIAAVDPAELDRRRAKARRAEAQAQAEAEKFRQWAIDKGRKIWRGSMVAARTPVQDYLEARGLPFGVLSQARAVIRYAPALPYMRRIGAETVTLHTGPAMVAVIQRPDGRGLGAHCTWIDPARPGRKAEITARLDDNKGKPWPPKLIQGSKKGGAIRLTDRHADTLVVGEGIETTLTALAADALPGADYWCGVDLGNMAGRMQRLPGTRWSGQPDMSDGDAFVPPPWVTRLVYIMDGDSHPASTRAKLEAGLIRAMETVPGLKGQIVEAPEGQDLNDIVKGAK